MFHLYILYYNYNYSILHYNVPYLILLTIILINIFFVRSDKFISSHTFLDTELLALNDYFIKSLIFIIIILFLKLRKSSTKFKLDLLFKNNFNLNLIYLMSNLFILSIIFMYTIYFNVFNTLIKDLEQ